jgi:hypothetical protein
VPEAYTCNPSYFGDSDWEDLGWRPAWANNSQDSISKITRANRLEVWFKQQSTCFLGEGPEFKPLSHQRRKEERKKNRNLFSNNSVN